MTSDGKTLNLEVLRLGNRQVEEDLLGSQNRGEGTVERLLRGVHLLVEELPADLVLAGQLGDCFRPGEHLDGQVLPLLRRQLLGRTRNMNSCRSWPVKRSRSGSGITLRDRDRQSSLTIHVCFLRETVLVGTNHPNMEETGSLENPIPSGKCYLDLNRARISIRPSRFLDEGHELRIRGKRNRLPVRA